MPKEDKKGGRSSTTVGTIRRPYREMLIVNNGRVVEDSDFISMGDVSELLKS